MSSGKLVSLTVGTTLWIAAIAAAFWALQDYASRPGAARAPADAATAFLAAQRRPDHALLIMAVHPECPCTDASLAEVGDFLARSRGRCDGVLLELAPSSPPNPNWCGGLPAQLGGVAVRTLPDPDGRLARLLGAQTSGHIVFMDTAGKIRFHGGLTLARGHRGRSPAQDALLAALDGQADTLATAPVYGCALETPAPSRP